MGPSASRLASGLLVVNRNSPLSFVAIRANPFGTPSDEFSQPASLACQTSSPASGTGLPSPSNTCPRIVSRSPFSPAQPMFSRHSAESPIEKNGPTVCEAVGTWLISLLHGRRFTAAQHEVESIAQRDFRGSIFPIKSRYQLLFRFLVCNTVVDRVVQQQWISRKIHLRHQPAQQSIAKNRKVNVPRPPGIMIIPPRVGPWLDRNEFVASFPIRQRSPASAEIRIDRRVVLIQLVQVAPGGIGLPHFNQRAP